MNTVVLFVLLTWTITGTMVPHVGPIDSHVPITYKMELNDPPEVRYAPMWRDF